MHHHASSSVETQENIYLRKKKKKPDKTEIAIRILSDFSKMELFTGVLRAKKFYAHHVIR